jgi:hypothetical protein
MLVQSRINLLRKIPLNFRYRILVVYVIGMSEKNVNLASKFVVKFWLLEIFENVTHLHAPSFIMHQFL